MIDVAHNVEAGATGFVAGFLVSIPVGPINLTIINEGARRGFRWGFMIGLGAVTMEAIYCGLAFAGFSPFFDSRLVRAAMQLLSFLFMLYLGVQFLFASSIPEHLKTADRIEGKLHPHSAFMTGFIRVLGNPGVLLLWLALAASFLAHDWVDEHGFSRMSCVAGVCLGGTSWFLILSYAVSLGHRRLSPRTLLRMEHISGACLLGAAIWIGLQIIWHLARR